MPKSQFGVKFHHYTPLFVTIVVSTRNRRSRCSRRNDPIEFRAIPKSKHQSMGLRQIALAQNDIQIFELPKRYVATGLHRQRGAFVRNSFDPLRTKKIENLDQFRCKKQAAEDRK